MNKRNARKKRAKAKTNTASLKGWVPHYTFGPLFYDVKTGKFILKYPEATK